MSLSPIGSTNNQKTLSISIKSEFIVGGILVCVIAALFKNTISGFFQTKNNIESVTDPSNETIDIRLKIQEKQDEIKKLENEIKKTEQRIQELDEFNETTILPSQKITGVNPGFLFEILKKYKNPEEIEDVLLKNLVKMPIEVISAFQRAHVLMSYFQDNSVDFEKSDLMDVIAACDQTFQYEISLGKKIVRHILKLSPQDQKVAEEKLAKCAVNDTRFINYQLERASNLKSFMGDSLSDQFTQKLCDNYAEVARSMDMRSLVGNQMNNPEEKYIFTSQLKAKKLSDAKEELIGIAQLLECSLPELVFRFLPRVDGESGEEIEFSKDAIYVLLENAKRSMRDELNEYAEHQAQQAERSRNRQEQLNNDRKVQLRREEHEEFIRNRKGKQTNSAIANKPKEIVSTNQSKLSRQMNQLNGASHGPASLPRRQEAASAGDLKKINLDRQVLLHSRILRWDCPIDRSSQDFLNDIKNFSDKNSIQKYLNKSEEQLIDQQRRHSVPDIEILLAQKWFLKNYAKKVHNPDDQSSENFLILVESFLGKKSLGVEMLSIGLSKHHEEPLLYHCFIHPENDLIYLENIHSFKNYSEQTQSMATPVSSKRTSSGNIQFLVQSNGSTRIQVSGQDFFTKNKRTIVFLPK